MHSCRSSSTRAPEQPRDGGGEHSASGIEFTCTTSQRRREVQGGAEAGGGEREAPRTAQDVAHAAVAAPERQRQPVDGDGAAPLAPRLPGPADADDVHLVTGAASASTSRRTRVSSG